MLKTEFVRDEDNLPNDDVVKGPALQIKTEVVVVEAIRKMKIGMAAGVSGVVAEILKKYI